MGLDLYVMPLWRFKVGDFRSPIEAAIGFRPKIVTADGIEDQRGSVGWFERWRAKRQVVAIRKAVEAVNQTRIRWKDDGDVVYCEQSGRMDALKAYAKWLDCRDQFPEFTAPPDEDYSKHPAMELEVERLSCPHLLGHDCYNGYFLPCEFEKLAEVEPYMIFGHWPASRSVGSSVRLLRELDLIQEQLQAAEDDRDPVKVAYLQMREAAELSCRYKLPMIFWG